VVSSEKENSLEDELGTMKLYMNIENIRFSDEIDFQIEIIDLYDDFQNLTGTKVIVKIPMISNVR
jgi:LytS/YehU family sensor histidine kinase